jgi:RHS repeat-associated protein
VYGIGPIARIDAAGNAAVFHFDTLGNTVALTSLDGALTDRYSYDPWGRLAGRTGSTPNPFTFHGQLGVVDDGNGLYYMRARYYAPELMRFTQADPMFAGSMLDPQSLNRYIFALDNPIVLADPNGENPFLAGVLIGVGIDIGLDIADYYLSGGESGLNPLDKDAWLPYFENNWLDLTIAGVTMGIFKVKMAKFAARYGYVWVGKGIAKVFGAAASHYIEEELIFPLLGMDSWTDMFGDTIIDYTVEGAEALGDFVYDNVSDFGEAAGDFIYDTAEDIGDWVSDTWNSIF